MSFLKDAPLRQKLTWLAMTCSVAALSVTAVVLGSYQYIFFRRITFSQMQTLSVITARNSSAALAFENGEDANRILASLQTEPSVRSAALYDLANGRLAEFVRAHEKVDFPERPPADGARIKEGEFEIVVPVAESKRFGTLVVRADAHLVRQRLGTYVWMLLGTISLSGCLAFLLARRMKHRITAPVKALLDATTAVQTDADYRLRVEKVSEDELGGLTEAFNRMLQRIEDNQGELHRSEERLRLALDAARIGTWEWDLVRDQYRWDARSYEMHGLMKSVPLSSETMLRAVQMEDRERVRLAVDGVRKRLGDFAVEYRVVLNGQSRILLMRGVFIADESGVTRRAVGVTMDVTERRRAEARVAESEQRFRIMAEKAPALIWSCGADLRRDYFNRTWLTFTGRSLEEEVGHGWREALFPPDLPLWLRAVEVASRQSDPYSIEYRLRRCDGAWRWVMETASPRISAAGEFVGFLGTCADITARKENEAELEAHVRLRTHQLEIANRELESFSYSVSHDLRSPVRVIRGFTEIALEEVQAGNAEAAIEPLQRILHSTSRMDELISAFIALARISRAELRVQRVDLSRIAKEIVTGLRNAFPYRVVDVRIESDLSCMGDERLLRIALENLLANAWKFTSERPVAQIRFDRMERGGAPVFFVRDNGAGFNAAFSNKLFQVFQRLHTPTQFEGLGVGLSTVHRVIQRHNGRVWGEGKEGEGAIFFFTVGDLVPENASESLTSAAV